MNLDHIITGNHGYDHPDNDICPDCGRDADSHCSTCGACGVECTDDSDCSKCTDNEETA